MNVFHKFSSPLIAAAVVALSAAAGAAETVRFAFAGPGAAAVGELVPVELRVDPAGQGISELPFIIGYDPDVLEVLSVEPGPFVGGGSFQPDVDRDEGRIRVDAAPAPGATQPVPGVLATVVFKVSRRFSSTPIDGMTMAPVGLDGEGLPPEYPATLQLRYRSGGTLR